jgi:hypothetical protein
MLAAHGVFGRRFVAKREAEKRTDYSPLSFVYMAKCTTIFRRWALNAHLLPHGSEVYSYDMSFVWAVSILDLLYCIPYLDVKASRWLHVIMFLEVITTTVGRYE